MNNDIYIMTTDLAAAPAADNRHVKPDEARGAFEDAVDLLRLLHVHGDVRVRVRVRAARRQLELPPQHIGDGQLAAPIY